KVKASYESFDFYLAYHAIHNFCVVDMSNFYLDIVKDTLYCCAENSEERKAVQTTMYIILDALVKLVAPILTFTSDEIWKYMPHKSTDDLRGVPFNQMPEKTGVQTDAAFEAKWSKIHAVRDDVLKALEEKRTAGVIGKPLDAGLVIYADEANYKELSAYTELTQAFAVSYVNVKPASEGEGEFKGGVEGVSITVEKAAGEMCERCWSHAPTVGSDAQFPHLCARCAAVMKLDLG
ncbi:MAG: class I tRNA ligase family protein, partial [Oscillospiraceae bacterium]